MTELDLPPPPGPPPPPVQGLTVKPPPPPPVCVGRTERSDSIGPPPLSPSMKAELLREANGRRERRDSIGPPPPPMAPVMRGQLIAEATHRRERSDSIGPPPDPLVLRRSAAAAAATATTGTNAGTARSALATGAAVPAPTGSSTDTLNTTPPTLVTVLANAGLRDSFAAFLEEEFAGENLEFLEACNAFADARLAPGAVAREAAALYARFVREGAPCEVNISGPMRRRIRDGVRAADGAPVCQGVFEDAAREVAHLLAANFMPRWLARGTWRTTAFTPCTQTLPTLKQVLEHHRLRNQFEWFLAGEGKAAYLHAWEALAALQRAPALDAAQDALTAHGRLLQTAAPDAFATLTRAAMTHDAALLCTLDPAPLFRMLEVTWYPRWVVLQTWSLVCVPVDPRAFSPAALQQVQDAQTVQLDEGSVTHIHAGDETAAIAAIAAANALAQSRSSPVCFFSSLATPSCAYDVIHCCCAHASFSPHFRTRVQGHQKMEDIHDSLCSICTAKSRQKSEGHCFSVSLVFRCFAESMFPSI